MRKHMDKWFLGITIVLALSGALVFFSAALGLLAENPAQFSAVVFSQFASLFLGLGIMIAVSRIRYKLLQRYSLYIFLFTVALTTFVFVPGFGIEHGGATRWLSLGPFSFQPAEVLKIGFVLYFATWLTAVRRRVQSLTYGLIPLFVLTGIVGAMLIAQPDTGTFAVISAAALAMFIAGGGLWRYIGIAGASILALVGVLVAVRPYVQERLMVFLNPSVDPQGAGYQLTQAFIAIASGQMFGRGFGQSVQKFQFLPEPISDSIFAVFVEEFGLIGGMALISLFVIFVIRGLVIAYRAPDHFARLATVGIVILIASQSFLNIGSMVGIVPLTGLPLPFVSHGGTALIMNLASVGIVLNISRYVRS